jgi:hypothetical protein
MENFMENKCCAACGQSFKPRPQVPQQSYCSASACQRARRQQWQRLKLTTDPDYRDNQARARQSWSQRNPNYCREYRETHPEYTKRNRKQQRERNSRPQNRAIAKMDVSIPEFSLPSGIYHLRLVTAGAIAKMDVWIVEIRGHACQCLSHVGIAKRGRVP